MYYQRPLFEGVLQNECSWGFCSTQFVPVLVPPFDKAACLRAYEFIVVDSGASVFLWVLRKYLMAASELSVLQKLRFLVFDTLSFII